MLEESAPLKMSMVGYLNTVPMRYGLRQNSQNYTISLDIPADCFQQFAQGNVDVALLPVGTLPLLENFQIITDVCIGCDGEVRTVCLFAHVPVEQITTIYLDTDSRTSVLLVQLLAKYHWNQIIEFKPRNKRVMSPSDLKNNEGVLLIGDKVFGIENEYAYKYDLGTEWKSYSGLPFVFAVWVARRDVSQEQIQMLANDLNFGISHLTESLNDAQKENQAFDLKGYFEKHIDYRLDAHKKSALEQFLTLAKHFIK